MRIDNPEERRFYEIEAKENNWSLRQLLKIPHFGIIEEYSSKLLHS